MDYGVVLLAGVLALAVAVAALAVVMRRRLPAEVLDEIEAVAASIRQELGELATEERVRWMAGYVYDVVMSGEESRISRADFETLVWEAVQRWTAVQSAAADGSVAMMSRAVNLG